MTQSPPPGWRSGYGYPDREAPRPGCVPLRPLGVGDILDGSFRVLRRNPRPLLGLSALIAIVQVVLTAVLELVTDNAGGGFDVTSTGDATGSTSLGPLLGDEFGIFVGVVASTLLGAILTGMLTVVITQDVLGVRVTLAQAWSRLRGRVWPLIALAVLTTVAEVLGLALCLAPGIWLWGVWAVAVPALMVEGTTIRGALARSRRLVRGSFWRVWGIRALGALMIMIISSLVTVPFGLLGLLVSGGSLSDGGGGSAAYVLFSSIGSLLVITLTAPVRAGIDALLYVDLRMRREGLDIVLQQATRTVAG